MKALRRWRLRPLALVLTLALVAIAGLEGLAMWLTQLRIDRLEQQVAEQAAFLEEAGSVAGDAAGVREAAQAVAAELAALAQRLPESAGATELQLWLRKTASRAGVRLVAYSLGTPSRAGRLQAIPLRADLEIGSSQDLLRFLGALKQAPFPVRSGLTSFDFRDREKVTLTLTVYTRKGLTYP